MSSDSTATSASQPWLNVAGSRFFMDWLADAGASLGFTTYQTGKLFLVGRKPDNSISVFERTYGHCMGMWASPDASTIWLSSRFQIWKLQRAPAAIVPYRAPDSPEPDPSNPSQAVPQWSGRGYDFAYIPRVGYTTGHLDVHDVAIDADGRLLFVNTMFGCLATLSDNANFQPLWQPKFLSRLVPEDRCHLNGLAMKDGRPAFVSVVSQSDVADGWRDKRRDGGAVIDIASGEAVVTGLSMPHSPRWHNGKLWVLNSGTGEFGTVDAESGTFQPICFCPGYMRGLAFIDNYAVVTLSKPRHDSFHGLELDERLETAHAEPQCGLQIIDLNTGTVAHWLRVEGTLVTELYDSIILPGVRQPMAVGFKTNEIERLMLVDEAGQL
ncbi:MAG: TIGR03032 family protein [Fuerstiella sp.]|nr:TIGR03032 family protein [Fuerstiella sp.]MCP4857901.1 TIGR03032 family protein [Fuerstiella sp.]